MTTIRTLVATMALVCLLLTSGCVGFLTGTEPLTASADDVAVTDGVLSETGYDLVRYRTVEINRTVSVAGGERKIRVTNHRRIYGRGIDTPVADAAFARFIVISTPKITVAGQTLNPVGDRSTRELIRSFQRSGQRINNLRFVGHRTVMSLGEERTVSTYRGTTTVVSGVPIDVTIHVSKFEHGDDYIIVAAIHPTLIDEQARIDQLLRGLVHPA